MLKEGLKMEFSRQKEKERPNMTLRKTLEGDFKNMKLTCGTAEKGAKERILWRKRSCCIILNGLTQRKNYQLTMRITNKVVKNRKETRIQHS